MKRLLRTRRRAIRGWGLLAGAATSGVIVGGAVALWLPGAAAASIGSAVAVAFFTATSARGKEVLEKQAARRDTRPNQMIAARADGHPRRVRDLDDPIALRVHPAEAVVCQVAGREVLDRTPPYVRRDLHDKLCASIRQGGFALVVGESTAGKTRAIYEAVRVVCPDHVLLAPANREALDDVGGIAIDTPRCVLWLDDLERFLGAGGLTPNLVNRIVGGPRSHVVIAATMRSPEFDRYGAREENQVTGADLDVWRDARDVLRLAGVVELSRRWTPGEIARARECDDDPRIRAALPNLEKFGLAEVLAAGPELVRNWHNAWAPGTHPLGAALVTAATDCRRAGIDEPAPLDLLVKLSRHYLSERGGEILRPEPLEEALSWATKTSHGASSLLLPSELPNHFIAFDYLVDLPGLALVPQVTWKILLESVEPWQVFRTGEAAARTFQHEVAVQAFREAATKGVPGADIAAEFYAAYTDQANTNDAFEKLLEARSEKLGAMHPETLHVKLMHAESLADSPHSAKAVEILPELIKDLTTVVGEKHHDTLDAHRWYAYAVGECGHPEVAVSLLHEILPLHEEVFGPEHISTLLAHHYLALFIAERDPHGALGMLDVMQDKYSHIYGPDSVRVLQIKDLKGQAMQRSNIPLDQVLHHLQDLLRDRVRIIGSAHPHTLGTKFNIVSVLMKMDRPEPAKALFEEMINDWIGESVIEEDLQEIALRLTGLRLHDGGNQLPSTVENALNTIQVLSTLRGADHPLTRHVIKMVTAAEISVDTQETNAPFTK